MPALSCLLTNDDFVRLIVKFCDKHEFKVRFNTKDGTSIYAPHEIDHQKLIHTQSRVYLFREGRNTIDNSGDILQTGSIQPKAWGWVEIDKGGETVCNDQKILLLTVIQGMDENGYRPISWLRSLLKTEIRVSYGIVGINTVYGGESTYNRICYSALALEYFQQGYLWKQFVDDNGIFRPI